MQLDQVTQSPVQPDLEHFQRCCIHKFSGQPVSVTHCTHHKKCLLYAQSKLSLFQFKIAPSSPVTTDLDKKPLYIFLLYFMYWKATIRSSGSLHFFRLNSPNSLSLLALQRCSSPLIIFIITSGPALKGLIPVVLETSDMDTIVQVEVSHIGNLLGWFFSSPALISSSLQCIQL